MKVRVYTDYDPVRVSVPPGKSRINSGNFIDVEDSVLPRERKYRNAWKISNGKIVVSAVKKNEIDNKFALAAQDRTNLLTKLGLTETDMKNLKKAIFATKLERPV